MCSLQHILPPLLTKLSHFDVRTFIELDDLSMLQHTRFYFVRNMDFVDVLCPKNQQNLHMDNSQGQG